MSPRRMMYDVVVVGCGAAGSTALARLTAAGLRAVGLEADSRRGGRVCTVDMGGAVELGAEWIHGEVGNAVYELARRRALPITKDEIMFEVRCSDGTAPHPELCDELLEFCSSAKDEGEESDRGLGDHVSEKFYEYIKDRPISRDADFCCQLLRLVSLVSNNYDATDDWNDITVAGSRQYREPEGHLHWSFGDMGYDTVFKLIEGNTRCDVRLNSEVTCVRRNTDDVTVSCADGATYTARHVVVTVSLGVLKERHASMFDPQLPSSKIAAIEQISMGVMDKVCLQYSARWWPSARKFCGFLWRSRDLAEVDCWMGRILGFSVPTGARNVITLWTSGETAKEVETMPEEEVLRGCKKLLQMFMGKSVVVPDPIAIRRSTWYHNRYTRGSYSYRPRRIDVAALAAPVRDGAGRPVILFAGEACSPHHYSTVHGAVHTGEAAAALVLQHASAERRIKI